jgi:predicted translin family RNA/ssDNA-binding protein
MTQFKHIVITEDTTKKEVKPSKEPKSSKEFIDKYIGNLQNQKDKLKTQMEELNEIIDSLSNLNTFSNCPKNIKDCIINERRKLSTKYCQLFQKTKNDETEEQEKIRNNKIEKMKQQIKYFDEHYKISAFNLIENYEKQIYT